MMGERRSGQEALFYEFSLERHVPAEHLLRSIDRFVELDGVRCELAPFYSEVGRPSIDPELMIRMLIVGYCFGIRSERRLCEEVHLNLAYRWFCRLGLDGAVPDHSTSSKNRHDRFRDSDLLRKVFETSVQRCIAEGLVGGEGFAVDASMIKADANRQRSVPGSEWSAPEAANHAAREYLAVLDDAAFGAATPVVPKFISHADPASRWTGANGGLAFFAYCTNIGTCRWLRSVRRADRRIARSTRGRLTPPLPRHRPARLDNGAPGPLTILSPRQGKVRADQRSIDRDGRHNRARHPRTALD